MLLFDISNNELFLFIPNETQKPKYIMFIRTIPVRKEFHLIIGQKFNLNMS